MFYCIWISSIWKNNKLQKMPISYQIIIKSYQIKWFFDITVLNKNKNIYSQQTVYSRKFTKCTHHDTLWLV